MDKLNHLADWLDLAIAYQAEVAATVADFARLPGFRWFNPLALKRSRGR